MIQVIDAVFENGRLTPLAALALHERQRVKVTIVTSGEQALVEELPARGLALLAEYSPAYEFLADPRDDVYTLEDGEALV